MNNLSKVIALALIATFISPVSQAQGASCSQVKSKFNAASKLATPTNSVDVKKMVDAYKIALTNTKCFSKTQISGFKKYVNEVSSSEECLDPAMTETMNGLLGDNTWTKFCQGFKGLVRYAK